MREVVVTLTVAAFFIWAIFGESSKESIIKENARQKTLIQWLCNDLPTHEACEGYQEEARSKR